LRDAKTLFIDSAHSQNSVASMADEEKYRIETPEEEDKPVEKTGFLRPLPTREEIVYKDKDGRPQPMVRLLGLTIPEKRRDLLILILIPALVGLIDATIYSYVITHILESSATFLFFVPIIIGIPIGLTASQAGSAMVGGFLGSLFCMIFLITFLISPGLLLPEIGVGSFILGAFTLSTGYFILIIVSTLIGAVIGTIIKEFF